jgi:hypothetical protein
MRISVVVPVLGFQICGYVLSSLSLPPGRIATPSVWTPPIHSMRTLTRSVALSIYNEPFDARLSHEVFAIGGSGDWGGPEGGNIPRQGRITFRSGEMEAWQWLGSRTSHWAAVITTRPVRGRSGYLRRGSSRTRVHRRRSPQRGDV